MNPIVRRELLELLRTRKVLAAQVGLAAACTLLVLVRWPTGGVSDLSGARSLQVLRVFGYGLLAGVIFLVPAFPATAVVREKVRGTLALLLNSPMSAVSIYVGKLGAVLGFAALLLLMTVPAAAACYALGGASARGGVGLLYVVLAMASVQLATLALWVSGRSQSTDAALRATYALVLAICAVPLAPHWLLQGDTGELADLAGWVRCLSPVPPVMEVLGHGGIGSHGMEAGGGTVPRYIVLAGLMSLAFALLTVLKLAGSPLDKARPAGVMTQDRSKGERAFRRLLFLVDPQRRSGHMGLWMNPVMVKEFRSRRFGRGHWTLRLIALSAILSLALSLIATTKALGWGPEVIGGALVLLQTALLILFAPSLAAGLISAEREGGGWLLLRTTPLSTATILRGKLISVVWPLFLLMCATLPGYIVLMTVMPELIAQIGRVIISLALTAIFAVLVSATASSLFRATANATAAANLILVGVCIVPLLAWLGRDAPFGHRTVEAVLTVSPVAAALRASDMPGFTDYRLLPANWWLIGMTSLVLLTVLMFRTRQLYRPE
jgi:ABC-type transport system involved in multi-copper enzyme maturation permease subunit